MTNLEKMNQLIGIDASKEQILKWAYMNRILFDSVYLEEEFEGIEKSVKSFAETIPYEESNTEFDLWDKFLDAEFIS